MKTPGVPNVRTHAACGGCSGGQRQASVIDSRIATLHLRQLQAHQRNVVVKKTGAAAQFHMICSKRQERKSRPRSEVVSAHDAFTIEAHTKFALQLRAENNS